MTKTYFFYKLQGPKLNKKKVERPIPKNDENVRTKHTFKHFIYCLIKLINNT